MDGTSRGKWNLTGGVGSEQPLTAWLLCLLLVGPALAACGGGDDAGPPGPDIAGIYRVHSHTSNETDCDAEGEELSDPPYFRLELDRFIGQPFYEMSDCQSSDPESCDSFGILGTSFFESTGAGWRGDVYYSSGGSETAPCRLGISESIATPEGADVIVVEQRNLSLETPDLIDDQCDPDAAEARRDQMSCERYQVVRGTRVSD